MSTQGGLNIVTDGLVFEVDAANKLGGNVSNTKNLTNPNEVGTFVNGASVVNGAYDFDGVDDYISFPNVLNGWGNKFTFDVWVKFDSTATKAIFHKAKNVSGQLDFALFNNGALFAFADDSAGGAIWSTTTINTVDWFNVSITWETNVEMKMYVNGNLEDTEPSTFGYSDATAYPFNLGASTNGTNFFLNGQIANFKIYNKILTATEIQQNYEALKHNFE